MRRASCGLKDSGLENSRLALGRLWLFNNANLSRGGGWYKPLTIALQYIKLTAWIEYYAKLSTVLEKARQYLSGINLDLLWSKEWYDRGSWEVND
jgi:hypothetical protein